MYIVLGILMIGIVIAQLKLLDRIFWIERQLSWIADQIEILKNPEEDEE